MSKIINSIRIPASRWETEEVFSGLLELLSEYRDCIDQIAFFTTHFHPPMPLHTAAEHCEKLKDRVARAKALGFSCGLNILATVGHHPERLDEALQGEWAYMTNPDGQVCLGSRCLNDRAYLEQYVRPLYRLHCGVHPDFIWIDDDVRYGHIPVGFCCFCDGCIARFNRDFGYSYHRPALKEAMDNPANVALRKQWLTHQSDKIVDLLAFIRQVVNECDDSITLGMMTGERYFEGYDFARWADALSEHGKYEIMWRPGGGNYDDRSLEETVWKSSEIGRQCANLTPSVTEIQSEIENHPHRLLRKGPRYTALEALAYLSAGCTGTALNILPGAETGEPAGVVGKHLEAIRSVTPFMRKLSSACARKPAVGIHCGWHIHSQAAVDGAFADGHGEAFARPWQELYSLGLPEGFDFDGSPVYLLSGRAPYAFEEREIRQMLSRGVYLDAGAADALCQMGYGDAVGFSAGEAISQDAVEVYAPHPLNGGFEGRQRYCPSIFCSGSAFGLIPHAGAEVLCYAQDFHGREISGCTMGLFRNQWGGTVCTAGYYPASELSDSVKSVQLKRLFRLLSGGALPAMVESYERVRIIVRRDKTGAAVTLLNTTPDRLTDVRILLEGDPKEVVLCRENGTEMGLPSVKADGGMSRIVVPELSPYSMALLKTEGGEAE